VFRAVTNVSRDQPGRGRENNFSATCNFPRLSTSGRVSTVNLCCQEASP
jgi:hypothetical protein